MTPRPVAPPVPRFEYDVDADAMLVTCVRCDGTGAIPGAEPVVPALAAFVDAHLHCDRRGQRHGTG